MADYVSRQRTGVSRRMRLKGHDYSEPEFYFVTVTVESGRCLFGNIQDGMFVANVAGQMVQVEWARIAERFPGVMLDEYCLMPNHFHALIGIGIESLQAPFEVSLVDVMRVFKSRTAVLYGRGVRQFGWPPYHGRLWHTGYYDHIVRTETELSRIRKYIESNPSNWNEDRFYTPRE